MAFAYYKTFTTDHTLCGASNSTDFPIAINVTDADLKTVGNGGYVQSSSGYDIRPYADALLTVALTFELVTYDAATGRLQMYVKVSTLDHLSDVIYYLAFGNASLTTNGTSAATWNSHFACVYHCEPTSGSSSSTGSNNFAVTGGTDVAGLFGRGLQYGGGSERHSTGTYTGPTAPPLTVEVWLRAGGTPGPTGVLWSVLDSIGVWNGFYGYIDGSAATVALYTVQNNFAVVAGATKAWPGADYGHRHVAFVVASSTSRVVYVEGAAGTVDTTSVTPTATPNNFTFGAASHDGLGGSGSASTFDDVRLSDVDLGADWILAAANQGSGFLSWGTKTAPSAFLAAWARNANVISQAAR